MDINQSESMQVSLHRKHGLQVDARADHARRTENDLDFRADLGACAQGVEGGGVDLVLQDDDRNRLPEGTRLAAVDFDVNAHARDNLADSRTGSATRLLVRECRKTRSEFFATSLADAASRDDGEGPLVFGRNARASEDDVDFRRGVLGCPVGLGFARGIAELRRGQKSGSTVDNATEATTSIDRLAKLRLVDRVRLHLSPFLSWVTVRDE